jgi:SAM-dependent methyltransferase
MASVFAEPEDVQGLEDCRFYHSMDLPGLGPVEGAWDLRPTIDTYLGPVDYRGKRVLDVGTASGYLTFEMERRGATVVSFDLDGPERRHFVPFADPRFDMAALQRYFAQIIPAYRRAYWLSHRLYGSHAQLALGDLYALPADLGTFDVVVLGMILPHLVDPFSALHSVLRVARDLVVITQPAPGMPDAYAYFMPDPETLAPDSAFWSMSEACVERMLGVLGFTVESITRGEHACLLRGDRELCSTYVARRRFPLPD